MVGVAAGEMEDAKTEVPKAVNAVILRIAVFYCGSILLLVSMLPTSEYKSGTSPFVTVFERLGLTWMSTAIQIVLIIAALSSLNAGLYSTGRVLRSLGMSKQAPQFTLKMSSQGVPWAGIVMTSVVFVFGSLLNFLAPDAFEIALEAAAIGVIFTWGTIFVCQIRLRQLSDRGVIPPSTFQMPGSPYTSYIGLAFLALVLVGMAISGWQASPYLSHKVNFLVVVFGIPILAVVLALGWRLVRPAVVENTGDRLKAVWSDDGPTYGEGVTPDDLDVAEHDPATKGRDVFDLNDDGGFVRGRDRDDDRDDDGKDSR
jgi:L-asparagine permease